MLWMQEGKEGGVLRRHITSCWLEYDCLTHAERLYLHVYYPALERALSAVIITHCSTALPRSTSIFQEQLLNKQIFKGFICDNVQYS